MWLNQQKKKKKEKGFQDCYIYQSERHWRYLQFDKTKQPREPQLSDMFINRKGAKDSKDRNRKPFPKYKRKKSSNIYPNLRSKPYRGPQKSWPIPHSPTCKSKVLWGPRIQFLAQTHTRPLVGNSSPLINIWSEKSIYVKMIHLGQWKSLSEGLDCFINCIKIQDRCFNSILSQGLNI